MVLLDSGARERAEAEFEAALKLDSTLGESHLQLGNLALEKNDLRNRHATLAGGSSGDALMTAASTLRWLGYIVEPETRKPPTVR